MATFKFRKTRTLVDVDPDAVAERQGNETRSEYLSFKWRQGGGITRIPG